MAWWRCTAATVVPVKALGLQAGRTTQGHRFEATVNPVVEMPMPTSYAEQLRATKAP
jgi:glycyl-tRNA synthetase beta chain